MDPDIALALLNKYEQRHFMETPPLFTEEEKILQMRLILCMNNYLKILNKRLEQQYVLEFGSDETTEPPTPPPSPEVK